MQNITHNMDETKDDTEILSSSYKSFFFSYWFSISSLHEVKGKTEIANHFSLTHHNTHLSSSFSLHSLFFALCSFHLRYNFALQAKTKRSSIEDKAKIYRTSIEDLSKNYRRPIEDLSKTYRRSIEHLSKTYRREYVSTVKSIINCLLF